MQNTVYYGNFWIRGFVIFTKLFRPDGKQTCMEVALHYLIWECFLQSEDEVTQSYTLIYEEIPYTTLFSLLTS